MAFTRMVSLGSIMAAILFPVLTIFIKDGYIADGYTYVFFGIAMAVLVIFNHIANLKRIYTGQENRLSFK
jgi:glycerol-3-phosphate acyltransferase PlsY